MQTRKLVKSGAASHTIALPIDWIKKNKLEKGALLFLNEQDNTIIISPNTEQQQEQKEIEIRANNDIGTIRRETIAAYIKGYTIFTFTGTIPQNLANIKSVLDNFLALEIIEQTPNKLVAKDFLNLKEFSLQNTARRMDMLTRSMLEDANSGSTATEALELTDYEVDKLFFLISRLFRSNLNTGSSKAPEAFTYWWLAKNLENIADSAKTIAEHVKDAPQQYKAAQQYYIDCATAFFKDDKASADALMAHRADLIEQFDSVDSNARELLKKIVNTSRNIAKTVLDN
jgi:phosphate uptake regulator